MDSPLDVLGVSARELIAATVSAIESPDAGAREAAVARQARLTKPPGSLGRLEHLAADIAAMRGEARPGLERRLIVVAAGDHGVAARGVSAYPQAVTAQMVANFLGGGAAINVLADHAGARVRVVDAGVVEETPEHPELVRLRIAPGTADIAEGPALDLATAERAVAEGIALFELEHTTTGVDIVGCGEMGIANSTAAAALVAAVTGRPAASVTGRGTGVDDERFAAKLAAIERALVRDSEERDADGKRVDGLALLSSLGGLEIGVLAGIYLGAAAARTPAVMDGLISGAAALVAQALAPESANYVVASHRSAEPGHAATLEHLRLEPLLDLGLRLGEGSGAALGISLCVAACRILDEMATFDEAGVSDTNDVVPPEA